MLVSLVHGTGLGLTSYQKTIGSQVQSTAKIFDLLKGEGYRDAALLDDVYDSEHRWLCGEQNFHGLMNRRL